MRLTTDAEKCRQWRTQHPERQRATRERWRLRYPEKRAAHQSVYRAVKSGRLTRPDTCERCGVPCAPEASHDDYVKPLEVEWLCRPCHIKKDRRQQRTVPTPERN